MVSGHGDGCWVQFSGALHNNMRIHPSNMHMGKSGRTQAVWLCVGFGPFGHTVSTERMANPSVPSSCLLPFDS